MANTIRIKRRVTGTVDSPATLKNAELAFNEVGPGTGVLYYGKGADGNGDATNVIAIGGDGAFVNLSGNQTISGNKTFTGVVNLSGATISGNTTFGNNLTITGDLTVNGTTTTINSTTVTTDDKNIVLADTANPSDAAADGGGITLRGDSDKTFNWVDATDAWTSSEHLNLLSGKSYYINGTNVLSSSALGSGITDSNLTSVGTLNSGTWNASTIAVNKGGTGQTTYTDGQLLIGDTATGGLSKTTLTAGSNISITNGNGTISIAATNTNTTYTAGDGLDLVGTEFAVDLKANGGLVIESTELAIDLSASGITGTLAVSDGGTGAVTLSGIVKGNGTSAFSAAVDGVDYLSPTSSIDGGTF